MNVVLEFSNHSPEQGEGCLMEWVGVLWYTSHGWNFFDAWAQLNDYPACTDPTVSMLAQLVNDALQNDERQRLVPLIPRLVRASAPRDLWVRRQMSWEFILAVIERVVSEITNPMLIALHPWEYYIAVLKSCVEYDDSPPIELYRDWVCEALGAATVQGLDLAAILDELLDTFDKLKAEHGVLHEGAAVPPTPEELEVQRLELEEESLIDA